MKSESLFELANGLAAGLPTFFDIQGPSVGD